MSRADLEIAEALQERDDRIEELEAELKAEKNHRIKVCKERFERIAELEAKLKEAEEEIASLLTEYSIEQEQGRNRNE